MRSAGEDVKRPDPDLGWWEWELASLLRKTSCQFLKTLDTDERPSDSIPRCTPEKNENICPHRNLHMNVHSGISHNSLKADATKCPSTDEQNVDDPYNGIRFNKRNK